MSIASQPVSRLLLGTDFSAGSRAALRRVGSLDLARDATVLLLHVLPPGSEAQGARERAAAKRSLQAEASRLRRRLRAAGRPGVRVEAKLGSGRVPEQILRHAAAMDLVVVGRHGHRSFRDLLIGSTAERVLLGGVAPVLLATGAGRGRYLRPMVAIDLSEASWPALSFAAQVVARGEPVLDVVHAYEAANAQMLYRAGTPAGRARYARDCRAEARRDVERLLESTGTAAVVRDLILRRAEPRRAILAAAAERQTDLLVLGTHGRSGLSHWLVGSVAEAVMRHATCDVLVVPSRRPPKRHPRAAA